MIGPPPPVRRRASICLRTRALDVLMPMHVVVEPDGRISQAGPVLDKIFPNVSVIGARFFDLFELRRPRGTEDLVRIAMETGRKFYLRLRNGDPTPMIASAVCQDGGEGVLVNLSFGIAVVDAVARFDLAGSDFAATDLTLEMLYLVEANAAAMAESRRLNERLHGAKSEAEAKALSDMLTGLRNRRALDPVLTRLIARRTPFTLMHLDLDFFKSVNDTLGHAAGDEVLVRVARILREEIRDEDVVARVGGDEFVLLFKRMTGTHELERIAARLIRRLEGLVLPGGGTARISASIGIVRSTHYARPDRLQMNRDADAALYASKRRGRARFTFFDDAPGRGNDGIEGPGAP